MYKIIFILLYTTTLFFSSHSFAMSDYNNTTELSNIEQAKVDAKLAYKNGDKRVLGLMTRGLSIPGLGKNNFAKVKQNCGIKQIIMRDYFTDEKQLKDAQKQSEYISSYNQTIIKYCLSKAM